MKTIRKNGEILRLKDKEAEQKVKKGGYEYIPKSIWKEEVRQHGKTKKVEEEVEKKTKRGKN